MLLRQRLRRGRLLGRIRKAGCQVSLIVSYRYCADFTVVITAVQHRLLLAEAKLAGRDYRWCIEALTQNRHANWTNPSF